MPSLTPGLTLPDVLRHSPVDVHLGFGAHQRAGELARLHGAQRRVLLVTDPAIVAAGWAPAVAAQLSAAGLEAIVFDGAECNPTGATVRRAVQLVQRSPVDFIVAVGGGSAMDCAKGANLLITNGGEIRDYVGINRARDPMLPMLLIPTTAGTGSEAQSFALISDDTTHMKMACGDRRLPTSGGLRPRAAILDPQLTATQPISVAAATALDAVTHAVETAGCRARTDVSREFSREAWLRLMRGLEAGLGDVEARADLLLGAHLAGCAIEHSMLGAAHACANPLTARFDITHGVAVGMLIPHVVRLNASWLGSNPYADLDESAPRLVSRLLTIREALGVPNSLAALGVPRNVLASLADLAAAQWTASFNPATVGPRELLQVYESAYAG